MSYQQESVPQLPLVWYSQHNNFSAHHLNVIQARYHTASPTSLAIQFVLKATVVFLCKWDFVKWHFFSSRFVRRNFLRWHFIRYPGLLFSLQSDFHTWLLNVALPTARDCSLCSTQLPGCQATHAVQLVTFYSNYIVSLFSAEYPSR